MGNFHPLRNPSEPWLAIMVKRLDSVQWTVSNIWGLQYIGAGLQYIGAPKFYFQYSGKE